MIPKLDQKLLKIRQKNRKTQKKEWEGNRRFDALYPALYKIIIWHHNVLLLIL